MEAATEDILVMVTLIFMSAETGKGSPAIAIDIPAIPDQIN